MPFTNAAKHRMLNHLAGNAVTGGPITLLSLHTAFPPSDGNEVTGGSPAYARKVPTWEAAAGTAAAGALDMTNAPVFDIPAGVTVSAAAGRAADGTIMATVDLTNEVFAAQGTYTLDDLDALIND